MTIATTTTTSAIIIIVNGLGNRSGVFIVSFEQIPHFPV